MSKRRALGTPRPASRQLTSRETSQNGGGGVWFQQIGDTKARQDPPAAAAPAGQLPPLLQPHSPAPRARPAHAATGLQHTPEGQARRRHRGDLLPGTPRQGRRHRQSHPALRQPPLQNRARQSPQRPPSQAPHRRPADPRNRPPRRTPARAHARPEPHLPAAHTRLSASTMSRDICLRCPDTSQKRRGRDSNPRRRKTPRNGFRGRHAPAHMIGEHGSTEPCSGGSRRVAGHRGNGWGNEILERAVAVGRAWTLVDAVCLFREGVRNPRSRASCG